MDNDTNNADTDTDMDDQLTQFLSITGSGDTNQARSYLEMSGHDLQTAISLFMEHQGGGGSGSGNSSGATGAMGVGGMGMGSPDVRAPDETRRMRLLDFQDGSSGGGAAAEHAAAMSRMGAGLMDHPLLGPHARMAMAGNAAMGMGGNLNPLANAAMNAFADIHGNGNDDDSLGNMNATVDGNSGLGDTAAIAAGLGLNVNADANANAENMNMNMDGSLRDIMNRAASASSSNGTTRGVLASASASSNSTRLASMFAEPTHLTHKAGGFQGARNVAKDTRRWLLVNLQSDSDFACHALNRDVWREDLVENLVREGFIFWQATDTEDDGKTYCERYNVNSFPHIGIIDPRTARLVYRKEGWTQVNPLTAEQFAELAVDFCSRHSFDKAPVAGTSRMGSGGGGSGGSGNASVARSNGSATASASANRVEAMTEEQQLQAAIRASMNEASGTGGDTATVGNNNNDNDNADNSQEYFEDDESVEYIMEDDSDDDDDCVMVSGGNSLDVTMSGNGGFQTIDSIASAVAPAAVAAVKSVPAVASAPVISEPTFMEQITAMEVGDEPTGTKTARIMIRMPNGKRLVRKFKMDDCVKIIYAFIAQSMEGDNVGKEFVMKAGFPPKDLMDDVDKSIDSTGLAGDSITVRWKED